MGYKDYHQILHCSSNVEQHNTHAPSLVDLRLPINTQLIYIQNLKNIMLLQANSCS